MSTELHKQLVLVGGGHAHLYTLARLTELVSRGVGVTVVTPDRYHYYSGMGPGLLSGTYALEETRFDIPQLVRRGGGTCLIHRALRIDPQRRLVELADHPPLSYDIISCNCGSGVISPIAAPPETVFPVKPLENLLAFRERVLQCLSTGIPRFIVVGGGAAGVELAGNLERLIRTSGGRAYVTLLSGGRLLERFPDKAGVLARESLENRKVQVVEGARVAAWKESAALMDNGSEYPFDAALIASGVAPSPLFRTSGLPVAEDGSLLVDDELRCVAYPEILGGGDCISLAGRPLDRVGVYAVRQAPVIHANIIALLNGTEMRKFTPQTRYLQLLNLGDGTALLIRDSVVFRGKSAFFLKDYLDRSFTRQYQSS